MQKVFYKVVVRGKSCSIAADGFETSYRLNRWAKSPAANTPLFVFTSLKAARRFAFGCGFGPSPAKSSPPSIYKCAVENPRQSPPTIAATLLRASLQDYWEDNLLFRGYRTRPSPEGTMVADRVKLTKRIL